MLSVLVTFAMIFLQTFVTLTDGGTAVNRVGAFSLASSMHSVRSRISQLHSVCPVLSRGATGKQLQKEILQAVRESSLEHQVEPQLVLAVIASESNCRTRVRSPRGALGLMQLMPRTARWLGARRPFSVRDNIDAGTKYLSYLLEMFDGDLELSIAAYNSGPFAVKRYDAVPPYGETRRYLKKVLKTYRNLGGQSDDVTAA